jgi:peptidoglycan hydrolase-like protein with peptidoglycan-binding domain
MLVRYQRGSNVTVDPPTRTARPQPHVAAPPRSIDGGAGSRAPDPEPLADGHAGLLVAPQTLVRLASVVGNRTVSGLVASRTAQRIGDSGPDAPGTAPDTAAAAPAPLGAGAGPAAPLSPAEVLGAIGYTKRRYDVRSQLLLQESVGAHADGDFGPESAQAVARFQHRAATEPIDGMVGELTLSAMLRDRRVAPDTDEPSPGDAAAAAQARAFTSAGFVHLVADLYDLPVATGALSVRLVESLAGTQATRFEAGNLPVVALGFAAFADAPTLRDAIAAGLAAEPAKPEVPGERPSFLSSRQEGDAIRYDRDRLGDGLPTRIVQGVVGAVPDGSWGPDTVERIARMQAAEGLDDVDGKVGLQTLEIVHARLLELGAFDAIVRLIAAHFDLDATGMLDIASDADLPMSGPGGVGGGITLAPQGIRSPAIVRIRPSALGTVGGAASTIAHELVHVRQDFAGDRRRTADLEFEAHSEEILAPSLRDPRIVPAARLFDKARLIVNRLFWDMFEDARVAAWPRFKELRAVVRARFDALPSAGREPFADTMRRLDAVTDPLERPEAATDGV